MDMKQGVYKFVKIAGTGEYRFWCIDSGSHEQDVMHSQKVKYEETAEAAGIILIGKDYWRPFNMHSESLNIGVEQRHHEEITKELGLREEV